MVDEAGEGDLRRVCDYTHLNPVRAGIVAGDEPLESYEWSSYPQYLKSARKRPEWLRVDRLLGEHGIRRDNAAGRREFSRGMEARRGEEDVEFRQTLKRGWRLGGEDFLDRLQERMAENSTENHDPRQVGEAMAVRASKMIEEELRRVKLRREDLGRMRKGDPVKVRLAERLHRETPMTLRWIAEALQMGSWRYVSFLLYQRRRKI